jgi:predicted DNA-binding transcriptional regulator AlpA
MSEGHDALPHLIKTRAAASSIGVTVETLRRWVRVEPNFPKPVCVGRHLYFDRNELAAWLESRRAAAD